MSKVWWTDNYLATEESDHADQFSICGFVVVVRTSMSPEKALEDMFEDAFDGLENKEQENLTTL